LDLKGNHYKRLETLGI